MGGSNSGRAPTLLEQWFQIQSEAVSHFLDAASAQDGKPDQGADAAEWQAWLTVASKLQRLVLDFQAERMVNGHAAQPRGFDPRRCIEFLQTWSRQTPLGDPQVQQKLWTEGLELWTSVLASVREGGGDQSLPRYDRRFADPLWRERPIFVLLHQTYLLLAEELMLLAGKAPGIDSFRREQLRFATRLLVEALSPAHLPLTNPVVIERTLATRGENLVRGMENLLADVRRGQITQSDPDAFVVGRDLAVTPGKVVHETPLYQLIQYSPATARVGSVPLVIFPPWINRYYILDLSPANSMVRWLVEQGITVFMVSWRSADASLADMLWDDYVLAQVEIIDHVRERLSVPSVHALGYCVAGTTLAATLALLTARGMADKVCSATFFTTQVDFAKAGDLRLLVDDAQLAVMESLVQDGCLDGRYPAAGFNMLRAPDLVWRYVIDHYLLGEDYRAFDMLHWNGDTAKLPWGWLKRFLLDLYRGNRLVEPHALVIDGTPIDLSLIETPAYVQAGRDDHIAPAESVWLMNRHLRGPVRFVLSGSGHIAGVVNPPAQKKYRFWTNPERCATLDAFMAGAEETPGSWWPDWLAWLREVDPATVRATGRRNPGGRGDPVIEDAPGRYVLC